MSRKEYMREYNRQYRIRNQERLSGYYKEWKTANYEAVAEYKKQWRTDNAEKLRNYFREYRKIRYLEDPLYAFKKRIRNLIGVGLSNRGYSKRSKTFHIVGCDFHEFVKHIESQFVDGMSWDNRAEWHIDHIVPLASATSEEHVLRLNHFTNLRPLWAIDNLRKGASCASA